MHLKKHLSLKIFRNENYPQGNIGRVTIKIILQVKNEIMF